MTEENKTIQTKNNPPVDETAPMAEQAEQSRAPADKTPAPPNAKLTEPPVPTEPEIQEQTVPEKPSALPAKTEAQQAIEPDQKPQAPIPEKIEQAEQITEKQSQIVENLVKDEAVLPVKEKPDQTDEKNTGPKTKTNPPLTGEPKPTPQPEVKTANPDTAPPASIQPAQSSAPVSSPAKPASTAKPAEKPFMARYLNKLAEQLNFANAKRKQKVQTNLDKIMKYAIETQKVTNDDVEKLTGIKHWQSAKYLKTLVKRGLLIRFGKTKNTFYKPIKK